MNKYYGKTAQIQTEIRADREEFIELLGENPDNKTLQFVGISIGQWEKIKVGQLQNVPISAWRLATFQRYFNLGDVLGSDWSDFFICRDKLALPGLKYPLNAQDLRTVWLDLQTLPAIRCELEDLRRASDWIPVSPMVRDWLHGLGKRPALVFPG